MQEYFSNLVKIAVEYLDLRNPGDKDWRSSGVAEAHSIIEKLRRENSENLELGVEATDIKAAEMALLQQLWAHQHFQHRSKRTPAAEDGAEKEDCVENPSRVGPSTVTGAENAAAAAEDAASSLPCSLEGSSPPKTPSRPSSPQKNVIPEDLLELFCIAQALRSSASGRTKPSPPKEAATAVPKPLDPPTGGCPSQTPVALEEDEYAEASRMARLCLHYFRNLSPTHASPMPTAARPPSGNVQQLVNVQVKTTEAPKGAQQKRRCHTTPLLRPTAATAAQPPLATNSSDPLSPHSLSTPEAWRRLIAQHDSLDRAQMAQGDLWSLPQPRTWTTAADDAAEKKAKHGSSSNTNISVHHNNMDRRSDEASKPASEPPFHPTKGNATTDNSHHRGGASDTERVRLPLLHTHASSTPAGKRSSFSVTPPLPPPNSSSTSGPATGTAAAPPPPPPPKHKNGDKKVKKRVGGGIRHRELRLLNNAVVLPPNYSGEHGQGLTVAQLEHLAVCVSRDGAAADDDLKRQYDAADAAAAELHRLQQAVAHVLLENVQLERDISILKVKSNACAGDGEDGDTDGVDQDRAAILWEKGRSQGDGDHHLQSNRHRGTVQGGACTGPMSCVSTLTLPPACAETRMRHLILPPAPIPLSRAKHAFPVASLLLRRTGPEGAVAQPLPRRQQNVMKESAKPRRKSPRKETASTAMASSQQDPRTILEELRAAIASRQAETKRTLAKIDDVKIRIKHHDALMNAVAEYWRRNAAVMKRQHFAVRSQPQYATSSDKVTQLGDDGDKWTSENPIDDIASSILFRASPATGKDAVSTGSSYTPPSSVDRKRSHSVTVTGIMSSPRHMVNLEGSPSQLQLALAHMEAVSPTQLSSAPSFDLRVTSPVTGEHTSPLQMGILWQRQLAHPPRRAQESDSATNMADAGDTTDIGGATDGAIEGESTPIRLRSGVCVTPLENKRGGRPHRKVVGPLQEEFPADAAAVQSLTLTDTNTSATTSPHYPDTISQTMGQSPIASTAVPLDSPAALERQWGSDTHTHDVLLAAQQLFSAIPCGPSGKPLSSLPTTCTQAHMAKAGQDSVDGSSLPSTHHPHHSRESTANFSRHHPSGSTRREDDENVLNDGSWRTIPALHLENVDEIAEFIYSVFERS
ncbi:hypothetical protein JKF63_07421 [Porcisia hertigi]|uniref:Uncharacterized protein n=1 Tax=Porcisia hertigi TaxID=2761500 RepID=A0A836YJ30_9TRYP|nr:hypothetical protein JKF63_07421 [Porcisia hertigi]